MDSRLDFILKTLAQLYPSAACALVHRNPFELLCAVILSAQTKDEAVNKVTVDLFKRYPDAVSLSQAKHEDVEEIIKSLGLYHHKAASLILTAQELVNKYQGEVPATRAELEALSGVGRKTANVILAVAFGVPALAVDTHVARVSKRLGLVAAKDNVLTIEKKLCQMISIDQWSSTHQRLIFFGRDICNAKKPQCQRCPLCEICTSKQKKEK